MQEENQQVPQQTEGGQDDDQQLQGQDSQQSQDTPQQDWNVPAGGEEEAPVEGAPAEEGDEGEDQGA